MTKSLSKTLGQLTALSLLLLFSLLGQAHNNVVVIPMSGDDLKPLKNIVTVAESNGDFTDPVAAMASITDADIDNRYLLVIAPGIYNLASQLVLKEYVDISGSGRNSTKLSGSISSSGTIDGTSALVVGANNASLHDLSLENRDGASTTSLGIYNSGITDLQLSDLSITVTGGTNQYGVYNDSSSPSLSYMSITITGGVNQYGVRNTFSSSPTLSNIHITVSGVSNNQIGIQNTSFSSPTLSNISITVSGGDAVFGVTNSDSSPTLSNIIITVSGGSSQRGVSNTSSLPSMSNMSITVSGGSTQYGVYNSSTSTTLSNMSITVSGGSSTQYGVFNTSSSSTTLSNIRIAVSGGSGSEYGVYNNDTTSSVRIRNSAISAPTTNSIFAGTPSGSGETYVSDSILTGSVDGDPVCSFVFEDTGTALDSSCQTP